LDTLITNGYVQLISKATRVQNGNISLIDHVMTNTNQKKYNAEMIIDDLSDHFMNFIEITQDKPSKNSLKNETKKLINEANTINLKNALLNTDWTPVYVEENVDSSFDCFWNMFSALYDELFPLTHVKFNKNKHRINGYMTDELLESRNVKLFLYKKAIKTINPKDHATYIQHKNAYNTLLRQSKQKYYRDNLMKIVKNSKRTWGLLKEVANLNKSTANVEKIENMAS
jgi:hypothetical protein